MSDVPNYAALSIEDMQVVSRLADDVPCVLRKMGYVIDAYDPSRDGRFRATLDAIARWIRESEDDAGPKLERRAFQRDREDKEEQIDREREDQSHERGGR